MMTDAALVETWVRDALLRVLGAFFVVVNVGLLEGTCPAANHWWIVGPSVLVSGAALSILTVTFPQFGRRFLRISIGCIFVLLTVAVLRHGVIPRLGLVILGMFGAVIGTALGVVGMPGASARATSGGTRALQGLALVALAALAMAVGTSGERTIDVAAKLVDYVVVGVVILVVGLRVAGQVSSKS